MRQLPQALNYHRFNNELLTNLLTYYGFIVFPCFIQNSLIHKRTIEVAYILSYSAQYTL